MVFFLYLCGVKNRVMRHFGLFGLLLVVCLCGCGKLNEKSDVNGGGEEGVAETVFEGGVLPGRFSVGEGVTVQFSQGNLQYQASTGSWRFAEHQYDTVGVLNGRLSSSYEGWIDMFGFGTSGWESGAVCYAPYSSSGNYADYYVGGAVGNGLTGDYARADWGVRNAITNGGGVAGVWRTLTAGEWKYLLTGRAQAGDLCSIGVVNSVKGLLLLPDDWEEGDVVFSGGASSWSENSYGAADWVALHNAGAVFLPAAGVRGGNVVQNVGNMGCYWSSTAVDEYCASAVLFGADGVDGEYRGVRFYGRSVRLVK